MKKVLILGVVAVALIVFGYFYLFSGSGEITSSTSGGDMDTQAELSEAAPEEQNRLGRGTLEELRLLGEDLECAISYTDETEQTSVEGTYFVSGENMRGDFLTEAPDLSGQVLSSMIINDSTMYVWSEIEGETYGMKMDLSLMEEGGSEVAANEPVPLDSAVDYDCSVWTNVDRTVFEPPATVLFQDMSELMQSGMEYGTVYEEGEIPEGFELPY